MTARLERTLTFRDLTLLAVGSVIGSGIFLVPASVLRECGGSVGLALLVWTVTGILCMLGALTYGELGAMNPEAGGLYVYIRDAFGPLPAFLYGWALFLVIGSGGVATLSVAFATYLQEFVVLNAFEAKAVAVLMVAAVAVVNVRGTRQSADLQNSTTALKVGAILGLSLFFLARGGHLHEAGLAPASHGPALLRGVLSAMVAILWAYEGWQFVTFSAGEAQDPQKAFPRGLFLGTAVVAGLYLLANLGYVAVLGPARAAQSERIASEAAGAILGPRAGQLIAAVILVSMFSAANSIVLTAPRVYFAMARDGLFFHRLAEVHPRFGTPAMAIMAGCLWTALLALTGTFQQLLAYVVFGGWVFYGLGAASVFRYRRVRPEAHRPFRVPGYPVTPLLFVAASLLIVVSSFVSQPKEAAIGSVLVLLGAPAYAFWRRSGG